MPVTLLLFDVDGTLIRRSRAARLAFARALRERFGVAPDLRALDTAGRTDAAIMGDVLRSHGLPAANGALAALREGFLHHLAQTIREQPGEPCPGVRPLLDVLAARPDMRLALGTGNLERGARIKLAAHDLDRYFPTGGFGDDAAARAAIIAAGITRARTHYRVPFDRTVVVGDTPYDLAAARANGAFCLCVATGQFGLEALRGADVLLPDLTDLDAVLGALEGLTGGPAAR
ncbi:MAG: haloacid dehalogenase-like hydrolase [Armatimonadota bacterium]|nr:haloacid dehalogenase-like hydrolase [Armatimonadota bacterium]MDR7535926.1 haloacid dehalogenase-like hydrolase [Armatimonadota bacterium]